MDWGAFLSMGGRGFYVWGSYLVTFAVIALEVAIVAGRRRRTLAVIREELEAAHETTS